MISYYYSCYYCCERLLLLSSGWPPTWDVSVLASLLAGIPGTCHQSQKRRDFPSITVTCSFVLKEMTTRPIMHNFCIEHTKNTMRHASLYWPMRIHTYVLDAHICSKEMDVSIQVTGTPWGPRSYEFRWWNRLDYLLRDRNVPGGVGLSFSTILKLGDP